MMAKRDKLEQRIQNLQAVRFDEAARLMKDLGFTERVRGSHHSFSKPGAQTITIKRREPIHKDAVRDLRRIISNEPG